MNSTDSECKIAVATKDGLSINVHFGHAKAFWIYHVSDKGTHLIEQREVDNYCLGNSSSQSAMQKILITISDCQAVIVAKIGDGPTEKLKNINVTAVDEYAYLGIEDSLQEYHHQLSTHDEPT